MFSPPFWVEFPTHLFLSQPVLALCCAKFKDKDNEKIGTCGYHKSTRPLYKPKGGTELKTEATLHRLH